LLVTLAFATAVHAQTAVVRVEVASGDDFVAGARVRTGNQDVETDQRGVATLALPPGQHELRVERDGFAPSTLTVEIEAGHDRTIRISLEALPEHEESITISATRTGKRLEDQPMRVEVLEREEIEEKMLMTPGDIVMMLNEMGGMRVQATSPSLGAASVRIQGMPGRYTRVLSDGLPLYGQQVGGLGLLQIPPMDLGQVEVIKGVASALYGAGAMGGVIDLGSRRPSAEPEREVLFNQSTRSATDGILWLSGPLSSNWGATLLGGGHWQDDQDVDDDGWADLADYARAVVRPRVVWDNGSGRSFFATAGVTIENRTGGTIEGATLAPLGLPYVESLETRRFDAGGVGTMVLRDKYVLTTRVAASAQRHEHLFGEMLERDRHVTGFGEVTLRGSAGRQTWVAGAAIEHDDYDPRDVPRFAYSFTVPGLFVQDDVELWRWLSVSASGRVDWHDEYGTFFSPRLSAFARNGGWTARVSGGTGFFAPTPLTEETEAAGLSKLTIPLPLRAERGRSLSFDVTRTNGPASYTFTFFASRVKSPISVRRDTAFEMVNLSEPSTSKGIEATAAFRKAPFVVTGTYTYVRSRETTESGERVEFELTPRHSAGLVAMLESEEAGRVGLELYYTGSQRLEENPYRSRSEPYVILGLLAEKRWRSLRLFINGENLTGVRQTDWDSLLRSTPSADGRWTVDVWAPLDGRTINGGIRVSF
jgi:outer membrane receptor for ferrienterochelin and colicins